MAHGAAKHLRVPARRRLVNFAVTRTASATWSPTVKLGLSKSSVLEDHRHRSPRMSRVRHATDAQILAVRTRPDRWGCASTSAATTPDERGSPLAAESRRASPASSRVRRPKICCICRVPNSRPFAATDDDDLPGTRPRSIKFFTVGDQVPRPSGSPKGHTKRRASGTRRCFARAIPSPSSGLGEYPHQLSGGMRHG